jgi:hypothetical protein
MALRSRLLRIDQEKTPLTLIVQTITFEWMEMETPSVAHLKERKKSFLNRIYFFNFR